MWLIVVAELIHRVEDGNTLGEQGGSLLGTFDLTDTGLTQAGSPLDAMAEGTIRYVRHHIAEGRWH